MIYLKSLDSSMVMAEVTTDCAESELFDEPVSVPLYGGSVVFHLTLQFVSSVLCLVLEPISVSPR